MRKYISSTLITQIFDMRLSLPLPPYSFIPYSLPFYLPLLLVHPLGPLYPVLPLCSAARMYNLREISNCIPYCIAKVFLSVCIIRCSISTRNTEILNSIQAKTGRISKPLNFYRPLLGFVSCTFDHVNSAYLCG